MLSAACVALARGGRRAPALEQRRGGHDIEKTRARRESRGDVVARAPRSPNQDAPRPYVRGDDRAFVRTRSREEAFGNALPRWIEREAREPSKRPCRRER